MKYICVFLLVSSICLAKSSDYIGKWKIACSAYQSQNFTGHITESYQFLKDGKFINKLLHFSDSSCLKLKKEIVTKGQIIIGTENTNNGFNPKGTREIVFKTGDKKDLGLIWISSDKSYLRISKGFAGKQNTMLNLFHYKKY